MDEITLIEQTERYLNNQMNSQEKEAFEALRSSNQEIDQLVVLQKVEHTECPMLCTKGSCLV